MAMPPAATFDYVTIVPERAGDGGFEGRGALRVPIVRRGNALFDSRLVGMTPRVRVTDAGLTPNAGPHRPFVLRSRITLTAPTPDRALVTEFSLHVDKALTSCMRAGDEMHLSRTGSGDLGLSVLRQGELVVAVGAITAVPLGREVLARIPTDLVSSVETVFRRVDSDFALPEQPIEVSVSGVRAILGRGRRNIEDYSALLCTDSCREFLGSMRALLFAMFHSVRTWLPRLRRCCWTVNKKLC
jgi:hypothetical protein